MTHTYAARGYLAEWSEHVSCSMCTGQVFALEFDWKSCRNKSLFATSSRRVIIIHFILLNNLCWLCSFRFPFHCFWNGKVTKNLFRSEIILSHALTVRWDSHQIRMPSTPRYNQITARNWKWVYASTLCCSIEFDVVYLSHDSVSMPLDDCFTSEWESPTLSGLFLKLAQFCGSHACHGLQTPRTAHSINTIKLCSNRDKFMLGILHEYSANNNLAASTSAHKWNTDDSSWKFFGCRASSNLNINHVLLRHWPCSVR